MGTKIEWTDETWNPIIGCSKVSEGCDNCYAIGTVHRGLVVQHRGVTTHTPGAGTDWTGTINLAPEAKLLEPLRRTTPTRYFVNSLSDLFHPNLPDEQIARVFAVMALAPQHTFQVLTKRPQRMAELLVQADWWEEVAAATCEFGDADDRTIWLIGADGNVTGLPNVWLGTSIELDKYSWRADHLRATPAAVRFVSAEPLLGPLPSLDLTGIDWLIVGGESGPGARPMHPAWVRDLRDRCTAPTPSEHCPAAPDDDPGHCGHWYDCEPCHRCGDDTRDPGCDCDTCVAARPPAFFFKQWGAWLPLPVQDDPEFAGGRVVDHPEGGRRAIVIRERSSKAFTSGETRTMQPGDQNGLGHMLDADTLAVRVGKARAGRKLDGRTWDELPEARS